MASASLGTIHLDGEPIHSFFVFHKWSLLRLIKFWIFFIIKNCSDKTTDLLRKLGLLNRSFGLPICEDISVNCDSGMPVVLHPNPTPLMLSVIQTFQSLAVSVVRDLSKSFLESLCSAAKPSVLPHSTVPVQGTIPHVSIGQDGMLKVVYSSGPYAGHVYSVSALELRLQCPSGVVPRAHVQSIMAVDTRTAGNYAVEISWSDGHKSLFTPDILKQACDTITKKSN